MKVGLVGARGYVGAELISLLAGHPGLELGFAASRQGVGEGVVPAPLYPETPNTCGGASSLKSPSSGASPSCMPVA